MKVLCVIDHFGSGGAQRQMANLASGMKRRGHDVECFNYFPRFAFFRKHLEEAGIPIHDHPKGRGFSPSVLGGLAGRLRRGRYDVVLSYLDSPNVYVELCRPIAPKTRFVVSERSSHHGDGRAFPAAVRRHLHRLADCVVANSVSHRDWLAENHPWLRARCVAIFNGTDTSLFRGAPREAPGPREARLIAIGRVGPEKNLLNLIRALALFGSANGWMPAVSWVGRRADDYPEGKEYCRKVDDLLESLPEVRARWTWMGERPDIPALLGGHHALIHPSFYEGLPNVICEALSAGRPVLASDVCDNGVLVPEGRRGFLFDPRSPESIASALGRFVSLDPRGWERMSDAAGGFAREELSIDRMVSRYEGLFTDLIARGTVGGGRLCAG